MDDVYSRKGPKGGRYYAMEFTKASLPLEVDGIRANAHHRAIFGYPMDDGHDERISAMLPSLSEEDRVRHELFQVAIKCANEARKFLITEHHFLSTAEAIAALEHGPISADREAFLVMRRWGIILAVPDHGRWLYPAFQFNDGRVSPYVRQVHEKLRDQAGGVTPDPWNELTFWTLYREHLSNRSLQQVIWRQGDLHLARFIIDNAQI